MDALTGSYKRNVKNQQNEMSDGVHYGITVYRYIFD